MFPQEHRINVKSLLFALVVLVAAIGVVMALMTTTGTSSSDIRSKAAEEVTIVKSWEFVGGVSETPKWRSANANATISYITSDSDGAMRVNNWKYATFKDPKTGQTFDIDPVIFSGVMDNSKIFTFNQGLKKLHVRMRLEKEPQDATDTFKFKFTVTEFPGAGYVNEVIPVSVPTDGLWHEYTLSLSHLNAFPVMSLTMTLGRRKNDKERGTLDIDYIRFEQPR